MKRTILAFAIFVILGFMPYSTSAVVEFGFGGMILAACNNPHPLPGENMEDFNKNRNDRIQECYDENLDLGLIPLILKHLVLSIRKTVSPEELIKSF
ncbi:MAG: hypothetical protein MI867_23635 [Pseudomonadales bacterium]|nr:hypothetical protein [Pseudomonadales bacterium]